MIVDLALLKQHVMADDFEDDDTLLTTYAEAAENAVFHEIHRTLEEIEEAFSGVPVELKVAVMQLAAHWYNQREAVAGSSMFVVPASFKLLLKPFTKL
jgi:uncharacterized phage protein (predicted DNA packaging)